jgi:hypothetical protein
MKDGNAKFKGKSLHDEFGTTIYLKGKEYLWFYLVFSEGSSELVGFNLTSWAFERMGNFASEIEEMESAVDDTDAGIEKDTDTELKSSDLAEALRRKFPRISPVWILSCHK